MIIYSLWDESIHECMTVIAAEEEGRVTSKFQKQAEFP